MELFSRTAWKYWQKMVIEKWKREVLGSKGELIEGGGGDGMQANIQEMGNFGSIVN